MSERTSTRGTSPELVSVSVVVDDEHLDRFADVVSACVEAGMSVSAELKSIGIIRGVIERSRLGDLGRASGVSGVEQEGRMRIAPPESDVQ